MTKTSTGVDSRHPSYSDRLPDWQKARDAARGERAVKENSDYLPIPEGFLAQEDGGLAMTQAYRARAQVPETMDLTIRGMVGIIHSIEADVSMPDQMQYLWEDCDGSNTPLETMHRKITRELLTVGRYGIMADAPVGGGDPYLVGYRTESIINWSARGDFVVLEEDNEVLDGFKWKTVTKWRVIRVLPDGVVQEMYDEDGRLESTAKVTRVGGVGLNRPPLVVVGPLEFGLTPDSPPLMGVANSVIATYQLHADYRHQLFMGAQETLFVSGVSDSKELPTVVGAGVVVGLPKDAKAEYVGPSGRTIQGIRIAINDEKENAAASGARLFDTERRGAESGEALRIRRTATTATLISIAIAGASALESALRSVADMLGLNRDDVVVKPNLDFVRTKLSPSEALSLVKLWQSGVISYKTLYENLRSGEIASQERSDEEELAQVESEGGELDRGDGDADLDAEPGAD